MKAFLAFVLCFSGFSGLLKAQSWMALEQRPLNLTYEIPYNWYVGGYMTSRSCHCTSGTINTAPKRDVNMVIFYSNEHDLDSLKKQDVWGYRFLKPSFIDTIKTESFTFELATSRWEKDNETLVIRASANSKEHTYVIYFWGADAVLGNMDSAIRHILQSIKIISK